MDYNFDLLIDRRGSNSVKVDGATKVFGHDDVLPLWVADMDFQTPDCILNALRQRCQHPVFGYTFPDPGYFQSIVDWLDFKHHWRVPLHHISHVPGIVKGMGFVLACFTNLGDKVVIQPPVYHPFRELTKGLGRTVVENPLILHDGDYHMDFDGLEHLFKLGGCKILLLSSPHNPGGVVWSLDTLRQLAALCHRYHVLVVSDEIHSEMTFPGVTHFPFPTVSQHADDIAITFMSPSKTFNIPGIVTSYAVVPNDDLRTKFFAFLAAAGWGEGSIFSYIATQAAYNHGRDWLEHMLTYVRDNMDFLANGLTDLNLGFRPFTPHASFLLWVDCRELGLDDAKLRSYFLQRRLGVNFGTQFGSGGSGWVRFNVGCPRSRLALALASLA
jgi:cystathionine beta-lyase